MNNKIQFECDLEKGCKDAQIEVRVYFPHNESFSEQYKQLIETTLGAFNPKLIDSQQFRAEIEKDNQIFTVESPLVQFELLIFVSMLCAACGLSPIKEWTNKPKKIVVYTLPTCPYCAMLARDFLTLAIANGVPVTVKLIDENSPYNVAPTTEFYYDEDNPREVVRGYNMDKLLEVVGGK